MYRPPGVMIDIFSRSFKNNAYKAVVSSRFESYKARRQFVPRVTRRP